MKATLEAHTTVSEKVNIEGEQMALKITAGPKTAYRLAQLDDYAGLNRKNFPWQPPVTIELEARISQENFSGTWGFGFWNDPFSLSLGFGGGLRKLPALPNAAWFFYSSAENYLSFRDDLPANGFMAQTFRATKLPSWLLAPSALTLPGFWWHPTRKLMRRFLQRLITEDAVAVASPFSERHHFSITWESDRVLFSVDQQPIHQTAVSPRGPLGIVIWIDNQFAALPPDGGLRFGTLANRAATLEIRNLQIS